MHLESGVFPWEHDLREEYLEIALSVNKGAAAAQPWDPQIGTRAFLLRQIFAEHATALCEELGYPAGNRRYWFGVWSPNQEDEKNPGWCPGFPHTHGWDGLSFAHVLQEPDGGGDLVILPKDEPDYIIPPDVGVTALIGGYVSHGIRVVTGVRPRVTMITAVYRRIETKEDGKWNGRRSSGATTRLTPG